MQQHPPCSVITAQEVKLQINYVQSSKGCRYINQIRETKKQQTQTRPSPNLLMSFASSPQCGVKVDNKSKKLQCISFDPTSSAAINGCKEHQFGRMHSASSFRLYQACGRTCTVEKGLGPLRRPAFPRGIKSSCGRPGACQSKAI